MSLDHFLDGGFIKIADCNHCHQIRPIPICVELLEPLSFSVLNDFWFANRQALCVARVLEYERKEFLQHTHSGATAKPPFFHHHAALFLGFHRIEAEAMRPIFEDQKCLLQRLRLIGGNGQHVNRFVKAGVRVDVGAKAHADRFHERDCFVLGKMLRAIERHVLDEVGHTLLIIVFED